MKLITLTLACIALTLFSARVSAQEPEVAAHGLILLVDFQEPGQPSNTIRVTLENRSKKPMKVIPPADIRRPWGESGWWYCGSYQFYLHSATQGLYKYGCATPQPPAAMPVPAPPEIVTLLPGQSIGTLLNLSLPRAEDLQKVGESGEPHLPMGPNWGRANDEGKGKPPPSGYALTVEYRPVGYELAMIRDASGAVSRIDRGDLEPLGGKIIASKPLICAAKSKSEHNAALKNQQ